MFRLVAFTLAFSTSLSLACFASDETAASQAASRTFTIAIRPTIEVGLIEAPAKDQGPITLGDLVDAATIPIEVRDGVLRQLVRVEICDRPLPGEERVFTSEGLADIVGEAGRRLETAGYLVEWRVPARSSVVSSLGPKAFDQALRRELLVHCQDCSIELSRVVWPESIGPGSIVTAQSGQLKALKVKPFGARPRGSFATGVEITLRSGKSVQGSVSGVVNFQADVPVLARAVTAGEKIEALDFQISHRDITYLSDTPVNPKELSGMVTSRGLPAGEVLVRSHFRKELVLKFGDPVRIQVGGDAWSVSAEGTAQSPAALGETVKVKVNRSQKLVSGVLKEKGLVEIQ